MEQNENIKYENNRNGNVFININIYRLNLDIKKKKMCLIYFQIVKKVF